jgi:hypothetical protein
VTVWNNSLATIVYFSDEAAAENEKFAVKIENKKILVEYEDADGLVQYVGEEKGQGHFELSCPAKSGKASLHMFANSGILEGSWFEGGCRGMWRIHLA